MADFLGGDVPANACAEEDLAGPPDSPGVDGGIPLVPEKAAQATSRVGKNVERLQRHVEELQAKFKAAEAAACQAISDEFTAQPKPTQKQQKAVVAKQAACAKITQSIIEAQRKLEGAKEALEIQRTVERERIKAAAAKIENTKHISDEGLVALVDLKLSLEKEFANKTDKVEKVWEVLHEKFQAMVESGQLEAGDARSSTSLSSRYGRELADFRFLCKEIHRFTQSGASRDELDAVRLKHTK